jgi:ATP-dependent exoDNAse (exonuclease V) beta subunit
MAAPLENDSSLSFPNLTVISASAGSGKTHTLTLRYVQFLLSKKIPQSNPGNILAITFTNNAANEMKRRILECLKRVCLGEEKIVREVQTLVSLANDELLRRAEQQLDNILEHYSEFQIKTIDSFILSVFKSIALELGFHPHTEIILHSREFFTQAFQEFSRNAQLHKQHEALIQQFVALIERTKSDKTYLWNPLQNILDETSAMLTKLRTLMKPLDTEDYSRELSLLETKLAETANALLTLLDISGLPPNKFFQKDLHDAAEKKFQSVLSKATKDKFYNAPKTQQQFAAERTYGKNITDEAQQFYSLLSRYAFTFSRVFFFPYVKFLSLLEAALTAISKRESVIAIDDVYRIMKDHITNDTVPEFYEKLGDDIAHFLIDEFQDTSPIQWCILRPLLEESLAKHGSLFVVGDLKQSIYGFRGADWRIMKRLMSGSEFHSVLPNVKQLETNFRSFENIVQFNDEFFTQKIATSNDYAEAATITGLSDFVQRANQENEKKGVVTVHCIQQKDEENNVQQNLITIIRDCVSRQYAWSDIAILTYSNQDVVAISSWLNEAQIAFISHSNLDVRKRKPIAEILSLLKFLDSPIDHLSFATLISGAVFLKACERAAIACTQNEILHFLFESRNTTSFSPNIPLYKSFQKKFPEAWMQLLEPMFATVGYLPLYDCVAHAYQHFNVFQHFPEEEAALMKFLEVVCISEKVGINTLHTFLKFTEMDNASEQWNIRLSSSANAVSVMTIHKAKGLGFPVVIAMLPEKNATTKNPMIDDSEQRAQILYITNELCSKNETLATIMREKKILAQADTLNKLYVAFTRAKEELYIVAQFKDEANRKSPTALLTPSVMKPSEHSLRQNIREENNIVKLVHHQRRSKHFVPVDKRVARAESLRGECLHRVLSKIQFANDATETSIVNIIRSEPESFPSFVSSEEILSTFNNFFSLEEVKFFFEKIAHRKILNEQELVDGNGVLHRCDRIIIDENIVTVIDFKTGGNEHEASHRKQVKEYMNIVTDVYAPKNIRGIIAYVDLQKLIAVE